MKGNTNRGVAGLTILLSLVTFLFVIGLLVSIFALMGGELEENSYDVGSVSVVNESGGYLNSTGYTLAELSNYKDARSVTIDKIYNATDGVVITSANYTLTGGALYNATSYTTPSINVSYTFDYDESNTEVETMNNTITGISGTTEWFNIFIVIGAMVVLILLTVIIITAIRGSGLMSGGGSA